MKKNMNTKFIENPLVRLLVIAGGALALILIFFTTCCTVVDPGEVGIRFHKRSL